MHIQHINKIIQSTNDEKMHELKDVLINAINYIKNVDEKTYNHIEEDLYEIAEGKVINREKAIDWVNNMRPKGKWSIEEIEQITNDYQTSLPIIPAYVIMNMLYSDFR